MDRFPIENNMKVSYLKNIEFRAEMSEIWSHGPIQMDT